MTLRPARVSDAAFLWEMLTYAASMDTHDAAAVAFAQGDAYLSRYVAGWGRAGDIGVVAEEDGAPLGAAWLRLGDAEGAHSMKLGDATVPELSIAVAPGARGSGVGTAMLAELIEAARDRYPAIVLSVREANPAVHLYQRLGFRVVRKITNRVGTGSLEMRLELRQ